jgi:hypothetical protein
VNTEELYRRLSKEAGVGKHLSKAGRTAYGAVKQPLLKYLGLLSGSTTKGARQSLDNLARLPNKKNPMQTWLRSAMEADLLSAEKSQRAARAITGTALGGLSLGGVLGSRISNTPSASEVPGYIGTPIPRNYSLAESVEEAAKNVAEGTTGAARGVFDIYLNYIKDNPYEAGGIASGSLGLLGALMYLSRNK